MPRRSRRRSRAPRPDSMAVANRPFPRPESRRICGSEERAYRTPPALTQEAGLGGLTCGLCNLGPALAPHVLRGSERSARLSVHTTTMSRCARGIRPVGRCRVNRRSATNGSRLPPDPRGAQPIRPRQAPPVGNSAVPLPS